MQEQPASLPEVASAPPRGAPHPPAPLLQDPLPHRPTRPALALPTTPTPARSRLACPAGLTLPLVGILPPTPGAAVAPPAARPSRPPLLPGCTSWAPHPPAQPGLAAGLRCLGARSRTGLPGRR